MKAAAVHQARLSRHAVAAERKPEDHRIERIADEMARDYQVGIVLADLRAYVQSIPVTFSVQGGGPRAEALKEKLAWLWRCMLPDALDESLTVGRTAYEKEFEYDPRTNLTSTCNLEHLPYAMTSMIVTDGQYAGVKLRAGRSKPVTIPAEKSWWLAINPKPLEPHGTGLLLGAPYTAFRDRQRVLRLRDVFVKRYILGWLAIRCRPTREDQQGEPVDNYEIMLNAADTMRAGGAIALSNETDAKGEYLEKIESIGEVRDCRPLDETIDGMDVEQVRSFGIHESSLMEGAFGSYAAIKEKNGLLNSLCLSLLRQIATSFQLYVIDKDVARNFPPHTVEISIVYPEMTEQQQAWAVDIVKAMLTQPQFSPLVASGAVDLRQLLESTGVPLTNEAESLLQSLANPAPPPGEQQGPGQYSDVSRLQWKRNTKAVDDVLVQVQSGEISDARALALLGSLGWSAEQAQLLIADAKDNGVVDDPSLLQPKQLARRGAVPKQVWTVERIEALALKEYAKLKQQLRAAAEDPERLAAVLADIRRLQVATRFAARLVGMASPWKPSLVPANGERADKLPAKFAPQKLAAGNLKRKDADVWRFPFLDAAAQFLRDKQLVTDEQLAEMAEEDRVAVLSAPGVDDRAILSHIRDSLGESIQAGETKQQFAARIDAAVALPASQLETLFRTNTHQAYVGGMQATLANPAVAAEFPYDMLTSTSDTRTRHTHDIVDGFVVARGTPEHAVLLRLLADYNCRCTLIPLSEADAKRRGIKTYTDLPSEVVAVYG